MIIANKSRQLGKCLVCDADATGINFGVSTCAPCKAFFRRNAVKLGRIDFVCQVDGDCPMTCNSRRMCNCCRLAKCFRVGMMRSSIWSEAEKESRRDLIRQNRQKRMEMGAMKQLYGIRPPNLLCSASNQSKCLSIADQTLLTNILSAYERTIDVLKTTLRFDFPVAEKFSMHTFFNVYQGQLTCLIEYFKLILEFTRLTMDDKKRLTQNHFGTMINTALPIFDKLVPPSQVTLNKAFFDIDLVTKMLRCGAVIYSYASDPMLLKLILIVPTLSSAANRYFNDIDIAGIYDDTLAIFTSQNVYVELLWRYIVSRLPSERDAVRFFNKLILDLLFIQDTYYKTGCYVYRLGNEIDQMEPLMRNMWPRTNNVNDADDNSS